MSRKTPETIYLKPNEIQSQFAEDLRVLGKVVKKRDFTTREKLGLAFCRAERLWPYLPFHPRRVLKIMMNF